MEMELEPRVKTLSYKVKAMSRESPSQKAAHVLETDLRSHWSTATNNKEWILLELDEPCLLSHIRVYNKSVLEWEIAVGLRYKPETFVKVRPRCEAPRRDVVYPMNYTPCRYVRISCLRGNPIAIFFVQLIGISVAGLEPEFQPVVSHLLPSIIAHKQDAQDMHLQLLRDITSRLLVFLPHLEADLSCFQDSPEDSLHFLAMLAGPWYPILHLVNEREAARCSVNVSDSEVPKHSQPSSSLTVSSNFEPRRSRSSSVTGSSTTGSLVFRPEFIFLLLRKASKESDLAIVCRMASRVLHKFERPIEVQNASTSAVEVASALDGSLKSEFCGPSSLVDYSALLGEEFHIHEDQWDLSLLNVLDIAAVEEGIFHVLFACASQSLLCHKLADSSSDFWSVLPLIQALLPALRPSVSGFGDHADNSFSQWKQPVVQQALSQIVATSCSPIYRSLLHACSGYLSSFSISHAKAACILIDLCSTILAPWVGQVIAKVDLAMELTEDLLGTILDAPHSPARARAALKYIILALSGQMDNVLSKYKEVKHKILFLLEMLEPFLDPAIHALKKTISFGDVSLRFMEKQEQACAVALNVIRTAVRKPAVLPAIESEWRHGSVAPSVLLSVLEPHMQLPPEIDQCKCPASKDPENNSSVRHIGTSSGSYNQDELNGNTDVSDTGGKVDLSDDSNLLFAPPELQTIVLGNVSRIPNEYNTESNPDSDMRHVVERSISHLFPNSLQVLDPKFSAEYFSLQADFLRLINYRDSEMKASEFKRLALDLQSQDEIAIEIHNAAIDALLLAADCYVNPFFMMSSGLSSQIVDSGNVNKTVSAKSYGCSDLSSDSERIARNLETVELVERDRDKIVMQLVLEAAELDRKFLCGISEEQLHHYTDVDDEQVVRLSPFDMQTADAITLVRQNQSLLFNFLIQHLKNDQNLMHEILMHCLVFLLHTATRLYSAPEDVIDIILGSAEHLNRSLTSIYPQLKEGNFNLVPEKLYGMQRRWILLHKLVVASTGGEGSDFAIGTENKFRCGNLIPQSAWMQRISTFSVNAFPLVRYLGWMAVSRIAKLYTKERLFLASDLQNLTILLSIFVDELALIDNIGQQKNQEETIQPPGLQQDSPMLDINEVAVKQGLGLSFHVMYPVLSKFLPNLKEQFQYFGESILEAVGLQLRSLSSGFLPDILRWFCDLCSWPLFQDHQISSPNKYGHIKGYAAKNAKAIILYILEAIVVEHMEAMVPEIPRVVHMLVVLCRAPFCDVPFLQSVMHLLKPIISYSLLKVPDEDKILVNDSCLNFESLCFEELSIDIRMKKDENASLKDYQRASTIFILANVFTDLSFQRRKEILESLSLWVDFTTFEPTTSFYDYLSAFHAVIESCKVLSVQALESFGAVPRQSSNSSDLDRLSGRDYCPAANESSSWFLNEVCSNSCPQFPEKLDCKDAASRRKEYLSADEIVDFFGVLENVVIKLHPTIESCWNLHPQLVKNLTMASAQCFVFSRCISSIGSCIQHAEDPMEDTLLLMKSADQFSSHWTIALGGLAEIIIKLQEAHCWEVASLLLDCLLAAPHCFQMDNVIVPICSSIKNFACSAPKLVWRLQVDKWLSILLARGFHCVKERDEPITDLFVTLLCHSEPEQRFLVLQQLGRLVGQDINCETAVQMSRYCNKLLSATSELSVPKSFLSLLVSRTWDQVVLMASSDVIFSLRVPAMALLLGYIPYVARQQLQSFLAASDNTLYALGKRTADGASEGPFLMLSLALIAVACLYTPPEDFSLIPQEVWRIIEIIGSSKTGKFGDLEKNVCEALCKLRNEDDEAKQVLKETLSSSSRKQADPDFGNTRESILQVLPNLTAVYSYFDMFSKKIDDEAMKLQEAEIELDILLKEVAKGELKGASGEGQNILPTEATMNDRRLQQIKDQIQSLEKSKLQDEIVARRQKKLLLRRNRQKYLEEAAFREEELLRDLDRERMDQMEKDIERERVLEIERAKTKELRHQLDIEKEKQTQRELQRELEQAESSSRSSRREFPSRPRDRYRERENGRAGTESAARSGSGSLQTEIPSTSSSMAVPVVLPSSRQFSGQPPTILQPRDRQDEFACSYEESLDFSKDSGDTGSVGDLDSMSVFDGQPSGFGSTQRQGPRGGKSRQILERRAEREGRREGKWERKNA